MPQISRDDIQDVVELTKKVVQQTTELLEDHDKLISMSVLCNAFAHSLFLLSEDSEQLTINILKFNKILSILVDKYIEDCEEES